MKGVFVLSFCSQFEIKIKGISKYIKGISKKFIGGLPWDQWVIIRDIPQVGGHVTRIKPQIHVLPGHRDNTLKK